MEVGAKGVAATLAGGMQSLRDTWTNATPSAAPISPGTLVASSQAAPATCGVHDNELKSLLQPMARRSEVLEPLSGKVRMCVSACVYVCVFVCSILMQ